MSGVVPMDRLIDGRPELDRLVRRIERNAPVLMQWRRNIARCSDELSRAISTIYNGWAYHGECPKPLIGQAALRNVLQQVVPGSHYADPFGLFAGRAHGTNYTFDLATGRELRQFTNFTHWGRAVRHTDGSWIQHIIVSEKEYFGPHSIPELTRNKVDLIVNLYRQDLGMTSWGSDYRYNRAETAFICYEVAPEQALWFSKIVPDRGAPADDIFNISFEWWTRLSDGTRRYSMLAMNFNLDFLGCRFSVAGSTCNEVRFSQHMRLPEEAWPERGTPSVRNLESAPHWLDFLRTAAIVSLWPMYAAAALIETVSGKPPADTAASPLR